MKGLPDCPHCDAAQTLSVVDREAGQIRVCECSCCNRITRVDREGRIVRREPITDVNGTVMTDP